jgi:hypothetical protein
MNLEQIEVYLREVGDALRELRTNRTVVAVGGGYMMWLGLRDATRDLDAISTVDSHLKTIVAAVAAEHDLQPDWLNSNARAFAPAGLSEANCTVLFAHGGLKVLGPTADWVFLMKLNAARPLDQQDMIGLWPIAGFSSAAEAVTRFYDAYPMEEPDEFLVDFVEQIATASNRSTRPD